MPANMGAPRPKCLSCRGDVPVPVGGGEGGLWPGWELIVAVIEVALGQQQTL